MAELPVLECTGCSACVGLCPVGAITMQEDREGFLRPVIQAEKCIHCGKCEKHCPVLRGRSRDGVPQYGVFAVKNKDENAHRTSQSGGMFYALAAHTIKKGGAVYGAALDQDFVTSHIRVDRMEDLGKLQGVKYVQSSMGQTFFNVAQDLKKQIPVLFSGTPCQVAGLYSFLEGKKQNTDLLLTADVVCYGVPSPGVFRDWLSCLQKQYKSKPVQVIYRRTDAKWGKGKEYYRFENNKVLEGDYYTQWYFRNLIIRPGCQSCQFCNTHRPGDITLGDFWGIDKVMPEFYDDRGVSLVMCSTSKGRQAMDTVAQDLEIREATVEDALPAQPRLQNRSVKPSTYREGFWNKYHKKGVAYLAMEEGFIPPDFGFRVEKKLAAILRKIKK